MQCNNGSMDETVSLQPVRLLTVEDSEALQKLDEAYAAALGVASVVSRASVHFYARSGHSFVAGRSSEPTGFLLAHAIWTGGRPVVRAERIVSSPDAAPVRNSLLQALLKSAYDAGVYDLLIEQPLVDEPGAVTLRENGFGEAGVRLYSRVLGSRGAAQ